MKDKYQKAKEMFNLMCNEFISKGIIKEEYWQDISKMIDTLQELIDKYSKDSCEYHCQIVDDIREQWKASEQKNIKLEKALDKAIVGMKILGNLTISEDEIKKIVIEQVESEKQ